MKQKIIRIILYILGTLFACAVLVHLYYSFLPELKLLSDFDKHNQELLIQLVRSHGWEDLVFLFVLNTVCVAVPGISNGIFCVLNGILYGPAAGFIVNWISDIFGQIILLLLLKRLYNPKKLKHNKIYHFLKDQDYPQLALSIGYLIPFIPSAVVAYSNALINKNFRKELTPLTLGTAPMAYIYAYGGDAILHLNLHRIFQALGSFGSLVLIAILILITLYILRKKRKRTS